MNTISHSTLSNGAQLIIEPDPSRASAAVRWLVPAGVVRDPDNAVGTGAVVEELLMRGTHALDSREQSDAFDTLGATRGTETHTFHHALSLTCLSETLFEALPLLTDMVLSPRMDAAAVHASKQLCTQSIQGLEDDPQTRIRYEFRALHAPQPAGRSPLGTLEGIEAITEDSPARWWNQVATPAGSIIAIAGGVDPDATRDVLESLLESWSGEAQEIALDDTPEPALHHFEQDTNQSHIALSYPAPLEHEPEAALERMAVAVLSGGMAGRLFTNLREKRSLCYSVYAGYLSNAHYARTTAYIGTQPERADEAYRCLVEEIDSLHTADRAVTQDEFDRAKIGLLSKLIMSGESTRARAASLAHDFDQFGRGRSLDERRAVYDAVTLDQLRTYLADTPRPAHTGLVVGPAPISEPQEA